LQLIQACGIELAFRRKYAAPYFHQHAENAFIEIVAETYVDTRSKWTDTALITLSLC
jgi:hypothetical protein